MSADYINIQSEKDKLADENARLMDQLKKMRHRNGFAGLVLAIERLGQSEPEFQSVLFEYSNHGGM